MRLALVLLVAGCYRDALPPQTTPPTAAIPLAPAPHRTRASGNRAIARLTPPELAGALLGMSTDELRRARPAVAIDASENYDFREHYVETVDDLPIHYYTLRSGAAMYQISIDFPDDAAADAMWNRYTGFGTVIDDLGGKEVVIEGAPWQVRVWTHGGRFQIMAVIEGSEWWSQYHNADPTDGDGDGGNVVP